MKNKVCRGVVLCLVLGYSVFSSVFAQSVNLKIVFSEPISKEQADVLHSSHCGRRCLSSCVSTYPQGWMTYVESEDNTGVCTCFIKTTKKSSKLYTFDDSGACSKEVQHLK